MEYLYFTDKAISGGYVIRRRVISVSVTTDDYGSDFVFVVSGLRHPERILRGKDGEFWCHDVFMSEKEAVEKAASLRRRRIEYHKRALGRLLAMKDDSIIDLSED